MTKRLFRRYEDAARTPNFSPSMDVTDDPLVEVVAKTEFPVKHQCGIQGCHTWHNYGGLVRLASGAVIVVGNVCGEKAFPGQFKTKFDELKALINEDNRREALVAGQLEALNYMLKIDEINVRINVHGSAFKAMEWLRRKYIDDDVWASLTRMSKNGDPNIQAHVAPTRQERETAKETGGSAFLGMRAVYRVPGIRAVSGYTSLKDADNYKLMKQLELFESLDIATLDRPSLKKWAEWLGRLPQKLLDMKAIQEECVRFVQQDNVDTIRGNSALLRKQAKAA